MPELLGEIAGAGISGYLVMLDALRGTDQREIGGSVSLIFAFGHDLLAFFEEAHHSLAGLGPGGLAQQLKAFVQALDLRFGLPEMLLEELTKLVETRRLAILEELWSIAFRHEGGPGSCSPSGLSAGELSVTM